MKIIRKSNAISYQMPWLTLLPAMIYLWSVETADADATQHNHPIAAIRIVDQFGRQAPTRKRYVGSDIFDVTVGPVGNEFSFVPDTVNIRVGDTVRWTGAIFTA
jgi:plastocyanin